MFSLSSSPIFVPAVAEEGLTLHKLLSDLPTDPASLFTLALLAASVILVVWSGRSRPRGGGHPPLAT